MLDVVVRSSEYPFVLQSKFQSGGQAHEGVSKTINVGIKLLIAPAMLKEFFVARQTEFMSKIGDSPL